MSALLLRLFGLLLLASALALPMLQAPDRPVETLVARWAPAPSEFIDLHGQLVHYRDVGPRNDPAPIVLLHGSSASLHTWEGWAKALQGQRRVISLDLPGFGLTGPFSGAYAESQVRANGGATTEGSAGSNDSSHYSSEHYARFVLDLLDQLAVPRFVVAGNSLGGEVAWRIAALAPQRVTQLVLIDAMAYPVSAASLPLGWQVARLPVLGHLTEFLLPRPLVAQGLRAVYGHPERVDDALVDRTFELTLRAGNRAALVQRLQGWSPAEGVDQVRGVTAPTLILWGGRDRLIPPVNGQRLAADIPGSRLVVFDDLGHVPQEEDPARTVAVLKDFLGLARTTTGASAATVGASPRGAAPSSAPSPAPLPSATQR